MSLERGLGRGLGVLKLEPNESRLPFITLRNSLLIIMFQKSRRISSQTTALVLVKVPRFTLSVSSPRCSTRCMLTTLRYPSEFETSVSSKEILLARILKIQWSRKKRMIALHLSDLTGSLYLIGLIQHPQLRV